MLQSNPFCKWFWNGFWVPKHLLTGYWSTRGGEDWGEKHPMQLSEVNLVNPQKLRIIYIYMKKHLWQKEQLNFTCLVKKRWFKAVI